MSGVPMITAYKVAPWEAAIARRLIRVPSVILTNLVLGENVVPEFIQTDCTPEKLSAALAPLLSRQPRTAKQIEAFARLDEHHADRHSPARPPRGRDRRAGCKQIQAAGLSMRPETLASGPVTA